VNAQKLRVSERWIPSFAGGANVFSSITAHHVCVVGWVAVFWFCRSATPGCDCLTESALHLLCSTAVLANDLHVLAKQMQG